MNHVSYEGAEIDGVRLTQLIKKHGASAPPVILVTALGGHRTPAQLLEESGADDLIAKPFANLTMFAQKVQGLLSSKSNVGESK